MCSSATRGGSTDSTSLVRQVLSAFFVLLPRWFFGQCYGSARSFFFRVSADVGGSGFVVLLVVPGTSSVCSGTVARRVRGSASYFGYSLLRGFFARVCLLSAGRLAIFGRFLGFHGQVQFGVIYVSCRSADGVRSRPCGSSIVEREFCCYVRPIFLSSLN